MCTRRSLCKASAAAGDSSSRAVGRAGCGRCLWGAGGCTGRSGLRGGRARGGVGGKWRRHQQCLQRLWHALRNPDHRAPPTHLAICMFRVCCRAYAECHWLPKLSRAPCPLAGHSRACTGRGDAKERTQLSAVTPLVLTAAAARQRNHLALARSLALESNHNSALLTVHSGQLRGQAMQGEGIDKGRRGRGSRAGPEGESRLTLRRPPPPLRRRRPRAAAAAARRP